MSKDERTAKAIDFYGRFDRLLRDLTDLVDAPKNRTTLKRAGRVAEDARGIAAFVESIALEADDLGWCCVHGEYEPQEALF